MADGKSKSVENRQLSPVLGEEAAVAAVDKAEAGNERSNGTVKPCADQDKGAINNNAS